LQVIDIIPIIPAIFKREPSPAPCPLRVAGFPLEACGNDESVNYEMKDAKILLRFLCALCVSAVKKAQIVPV